MDLFTTVIAFKLPHFVEINPIILSLARESPFLVVLFKIGVVLSVSLLLLSLYEFSQRSEFGKALFSGVFWGSFLSCIVLWLIAVHNVVLLILYI
ncbi:DUF5658 family protein [Archaeoglobus profundus]